ncbi:MAG: cupin domain-containing protein [Bacteroidota bacterium]
MKITSSTSAPKIPYQFDAYKLFSGEKTELIELCLKPGEKQIAHKNPVLVYFYIVQGSGILQVENEFYSVSKSSCIEVEADIERGWENTGEEELRILVVKIF